MAESAPRQSDHSHCSNCVKIKEERCLETKKALDQCAQAQEEVRVAKESLLAEQLEEAKAKIQSMQKTLMAFQIATTVGVTILGQEVFDKITGKVDEVKHVQEKITAAGTNEHKDEKPADKKSTSKTTSMGGNPFGLFPYNKALDYRDINFSDKLVITTDKPELQSTPWVPIETASNSNSTGSGTQILVDPPVTPPPTVASVTNYDFPIVVMTTPEMLATIQYPLLSFQDSSFVFGQGTEISSIPSPSPISVFAFSLINQPRRRMI